MLTKTMGDLKFNLDSKLRFLREMRGISQESLAMDWELVNNSFRK